MRLGRAERDGVRRTAALGLDVGGAEEIADGEPRVLLEQRLGRLPRTARAPAPRHALALDAAITVARQGQAVVLVGLADGPVRLGAEEVHGHVEVARREVGEAVCSHLVGEVLNY